MPRTLRIEYEDACYHVMNRGANRKVIFESSEHRKIFLATLAEIVERYIVEIHAYCLMDNHYHIIVKTPFANLSKAIKHLDGVYTQRFNRDTERDGPLFRGRYKAIIIETDQYFLQVSRYIHLNPVVANLCRNPFDFKWSSYRAFVSRKTSFKWLTTEFTLNQMSGVDKMYSYRSFIAQGIDQETMRFYSKKRLPSIYGSDRFIEQQLSKLSESYLSDAKSDVNNTKILPRADQIVNTITEYFNLSMDELIHSKKGRKHIPKMVAIYLLSNVSQLKHKQISRIFPSLKEQSVTTQILRFRKMMKDNNEIQVHVASIIRLIGVKVVGDVV